MRLSNVGPLANTMICTASVKCSPFKVLLKLLKIDHKNMSFLNVSMWGLKTKLSAEIVEKLICYTEFKIRIIY